MTTLLEIRDRLKDDLDLHEEHWKNDGQLNDLINKSVRKAFRKIIAIHEDYFLSQANVVITAVENEIDYPSNIYANKIKSIHFLWNNSAVEIKPVRRFDSTIMLSSIVSDNSSPYRNWLAIDDLTDGKKIKLFPATGYAGTLSLWYIREPRLLVDDTDVCDIDEFTEFVVQCTKAAYYALDGDPRYQIEKMEEKELERDLINTLTNMTIGNDDTVVADYSHYEDSV